MEEDRCVIVKQHEQQTVLKSLFLDKDTADVHFLSQSEDYEVPAHRCILAAASKYFHAMLYGGMKESSQLVYDLHVGYSSEVVTRVLEFIYLGQVCIPTAQVPEVIMAADYFNLESLLVALEDTVRTQMNPVRCCSLLDHLYTQACTCEVPVVLSKMQDLCYQFLQSNLQEVVLSEEAFGILPPKVLFRLVSDSHSLVGMSKLEMYQAVLKWIKLHEHMPQGTDTKLLSDAQKVFLGIDLRTAVDVCLQNNADCPQRPLLPFPVKSMSSNAVIVSSAKQMTVEYKQASNSVTQPQVPLVGLLIGKEREFSCTVQLVKLDKYCQHYCREFHLTLLSLDSTEDIVQVKVPITGLSKCAKISTSRSVAGATLSFLHMASHTMTLSSDNAYILTVGVSCYCISFTLRN